MDESSLRNDPYRVQFKENIQKWVELDDVIKKTVSELKDFRSTRNLLRQSIMKYMEDNNIGNCTISGGTEDLKYVVRKRKKKNGPKQSFEIIVKHVNNIKLAKQIYSKLFVELEEKEVPSLIRKKKLIGRSKKAFDEMVNKWASEN